MAYRMLVREDGSDTLSNDAPPASSSLIRGDLFNDAERLVIFLSRNDSLLTLAQPDDWRVRLHRFLGTPIANRFADARLEALRRYAVARRTLEPADEEELGRFLEAGFSGAQARELERIVAPWKGRHSETFAATRWVACSALAALLYLIAGQALSEHAVAMVPSSSLRALLVTEVQPS